MQANTHKQISPTPSIPVLPASIVLGRKERWCARCGESNLDDGACPRCAGTDFVDPRRFLRPGEYTVL